MVRTHLNTNGEIVVEPSPHSNSSDFDFLTGSHTVYHRKLTSRLTSSTRWDEFEGSHKQEQILKGIGNLEQHLMRASDGKPFEGISLRLFDPGTRLWSIHWADSRIGVLQPPVVGSFENGLGYFYAKDQWEGKTIILQFEWDIRNPEKTRWTQAFSVDHGKTWETNWIMEFEKLETKPTKFAERESDRIGLIELRNYLLKDGARDSFIEGFEKNLIGPQAKNNGFTLGQYRIVDEPNRVFWIRGYKDMSTRSAFLPSFYYGPDWKQHRDTFNKMIANSDNVYLLHPLVLENKTLIPGAVDKGSLNVYKRIAVVDYYIANTRQGELKTIIAKEYLPLLKSCGITDFTVWESELLLNDFPKLPVFQDKNLLVMITFFKDLIEYKEKQQLLTSRETDNLKAALNDVITYKRTIILEPTEKAINVNMPAGDNSFPLVAKAVKVNPDRTLEIESSTTSSERDYDFLIGSHSVAHRKLAAPLKKSEECIGLSGNKTTERLLDGIANIERHHLTDNYGNAVEAIAFRLFDPKSKLWSLYWADSKTGILDPPLKGSFNGDLGVFFGRDRFKGQDVIVQFQYDKSKPDNPIWGQAFSIDEGVNWEWNWFMSYQK